MIVTVTLTPALDKTVVIPAFEVGKVNRIVSIRQDPGGKGINVSKVLKVLGTESVATGILGGNTGAWIESEIEKLGIGHDFVHTEAQTRTNLKVIDNERHTNTDINEPGEPVTDAVYEAVFRKIMDNAKAGDMVVFSGKAPKGAPDDIFGSYIRRLRDAGIRSCLDADAELLIHGVEAIPEMIKPNDVELARLTGRAANTLSEIADSARELNSRGIRTVVVSLGSEGAIFARDGAVLHAEGLMVPVGSTVGAGDSMMAAFCHGEHTGMPFEDVCRLSVAVSAAEVMQSGTQPPTLTEIETLLPKVRISGIA